MNRSVDRSSSAGSVQIIVFGNGVLLVVITDELFCEKSAVRRTFTNSAFICSVGCVENNGSCTDRQSTDKLTRS